MKINFNQSTLLGEGVIYRTESDTRPGLVHYTIKLREGGVICSCEGWQFAGHCKHVNNLPLDSPEAQAIQRRWRSEKPTPRAGDPDPHDMH